MNSAFNHLQLNINQENFTFYKEFMIFIGWTELYADETIAGYHDTTDRTTSIWFSKALIPERQHNDGFGMNHVGFKVTNQKNVDEVVTYLKAKNIPPLFETPRHRPEFSSGEEETYYQVMFKTPDHILFEVMYTGKKE